WYEQRLAAAVRGGSRSSGHFESTTSAKIPLSLGILLLLMFSKFIYLASMTNYYTFYLMQRFGVSVQQSQLYLFLFLGAGAAGTLTGGPLGDRIGRKQVIWLSILGIAPFALVLPHAGLFWT